MSVSALKNKILPEAFSKDGVKFVGCSLDSEYKGGDQFQSNVVFVTATVQEGNETRKIPLVVKFEPFSEELRKQLSTNVQFHNEVLMYSKLLPLINRNSLSEEIFPKFYYGISTLTVPENDVILIEDFRPKGFKMAKERAFINYEHLKLAMEKLGKYHALSYAVKKEKPEEFYRLVRNLKESSWLEDSLVLSSTVQHSFHRALDPLLAAGRHTAVLGKLQSRVDTSVVKFLKELVAPEEPMAVLCHGDFCRNNMLFKYDQNETPVDVRFFDIATARYSSPVVDIAFFLFMNSTKELRAAHWDDLLAVYHESLYSTLGECQGPSLQQLHQEMKLKAVYGFVHASFFLPLMLYEHTFTIDDLVNFTPDEVGLKQAKIGGDEGTKLMMEMVEELVERGFLTLDHPFLK